MLFRKKSEKTVVKRDSISDLPKKDQSIIRAWCIYDWANSAFATSAAAAIFPVYFVLSFQESFGDEMIILGVTFSGSSLWALGVALSALVVAITSPILGAIADTYPLKKTFLKYYMLIGSGFTILSFFSAYVASSWSWLIGCYFLANIGFAGANVFYNSLLPSIAESKYVNQISTRGYAYGYIGGGLLLLVHLILIQAFYNSEYSDLVTRLAIISVGVWWFGWSIWTIKVVPEPTIEKVAKKESVLRLILSAFGRLRQTFGEVRKYKYLFGFLIAFYIFNDGVQTVIGIAGAYGADVLGVQLIFNMITILIVQFVAAPGAVFFGWLADKIGTKESLIIALMGWIFVVFFVLGFAPLSLSDDKDYDYQIKFSKTENLYLIDQSPELSDTADARDWKKFYHLEQGVLITEKQLITFLENVEFQQSSSYSATVVDENTKVISPNHPTILSESFLDKWPSFVRSVLWEPLSISIGYQWLLLGVLSGIVLGGSQALARALFSMMTPVKKSAEFFGFYAFTMKAASVIGPLIYVAAVNSSDEKVGVLIIWLLIIAGTLLLSTVNVKEGIKIAEQENSKS